MKRFFNICLAAGLVLMTSCSDDDGPNLTADLTGPLYGLQKGAPGSVDELIYNIWEGCGVYYLYNYEPHAFQVNNWATSFNYDYSPVKAENIEAVKGAVSAIQNRVFAGADNDFIHRNWFVRVFLCDELFDIYGDPMTVSYLENGDALIIPHVNADMLTYTDDDWNKWTTSFSELLISRLYLGASEEPTAFFDLRPKKANGTEVTYWLTGSWIADPDGRYSKNVYTFRTNGYIKSKANSLQTETINVVTRQADVADYINFLTKTSKEELDWNWAHFPLLKQRAQALIPYLYDVLGLDLVTMQNANAPDDPVAEGYFRNL